MTYLKKSAFVRPGWISAPEAAEKFRVDRATIRRWHLAGRIKSEPNPTSIKFLLYEEDSIAQHIAYLSLRRADPDVGLQERFWSMVDLGPIDACWPWLGFKTGDGYGTIKSSGRENEFTHRVAWRLRNGPIRAEIFICHHCDNPPCCNPSHLYAGTNQTNMEDMKAHGRSRTGVQNVNAKLNDFQVEKIRVLAKSGTTLAVLGHKYGVTKETISSIVSRKSWRHIK